MAAFRQGRDHIIRVDEVRRSQPASITFDPRTTNAEKRIKSPWQYLPFTSPQVFHENQWWMGEELHETSLHLLQVEQPRPTVRMSKSGVKRNGFGTIAFSPSPTTDDRLGE